jgi:hypothetical protein
VPVLAAVESTPPTRDASIPLAGGCARRTINRHARSPLIKYHAPIASKTGMVTINRAHDATSVTTFFLFTTANPDNLFSIYSMRKSRLSFKRI